MHRTKGKLRSQQAELERAVDELAEGKRRIERFEEFGRRVAARSDLDPLAEDVLDQLARMLGASAGAIYAIRTSQDGAAHLLARRGLARGALPASVGLADAPPALGGAHQIDVPLFLGDGVIGVVSLARHTGPEFAPIDVLSGEWTYNAFVRDVSDRKHAERLKDEFFALVSHELRTPLTSITGYLELVLEEPESLDPQTARFLEIVARNSRRLHRLVGDMLFAAQVEAGQLSIEDGTVDLTGAVAECVEAARPRAEEHGIALNVDTVEVPASTGDPDRIGQALDNLVSNALKFTPEGGSVDVVLRRDGSEAVIEVRDTGIGIPAEESDRLFDRFFRSSVAAERAIPGAGLGLTIVKAIVDAHGGGIAVDSEQERGTTF